MFFHIVLDRFNILHRNDSQNSGMGPFFNGQMLNNVRQMLPNFGIFRNSPTANYPVPTNTQTSTSSFGGQNYPQTQMPNNYDGNQNQGTVFPQHPTIVPNYFSHTTQTPFNQLQPANVGQTQMTNGFQFNNNERNTFPLPTNFPSPQSLPSGSGSLIEIAPTATATTLLKPVDNNFPQQTLPLSNVGNTGDRNFPIAGNVGTVNGNFPAIGVNNFPQQKPSSFPSIPNSGSNSEPEVYIDANGIFQIRNKQSQNVVATVNEDRNNFPPPPPSAVKTTKHPDAISFNEDQFMIDVRFDGDDNTNRGRQNNQRRDIKNENGEDVLVFV